LPRAAIVFGDTSGATLTPELAWSPPAMGKRDLYHLRLGRGEVMAGGTPATSISSPVNVHRKDPHRRPSDS
jgi:hypothetical protein